MHDAADMPAFCQILLTNKCWNPGYDNRTWFMSNEIKMNSFSASPSFCLICNHFRANVQTSNFLCTNVKFCKQLETLDERRGRRRVAVACRGEGASLLKAARSDGVETAAQRRASLRRVSRRLLPRPDRPAAPAAQPGGLRRAAQAAPAASATPDVEPPTRPDPAQGQQRHGACAAQRQICTRWSQWMRMIDLLHIVSVGVRILARIESAVVEFTSC